MDRQGFVENAQPSRTSRNVVEVGSGLRRFLNVPQANTSTPPTFHHLPVQQIPIGLNHNHPAASRQNAAQAGRNISRRLRVEDALSYLELVKQRYAHAPDTYIEFLDIMKDFKSQAIDTPEVIHRVSRLFRLSPSLITGFNAFLPPGFEVCTSGSKIFIREPCGRTQIIYDGAQDQQQSVEDTMEQERVVTHPEMHCHPQSASCHETDEQCRSSDSSQQKSDSNETSNPITTSTFSSKLSNDSSSAGPSAFDHAIAYVNKIKARFQHQPHIYHQFLDILHAYQDLHEDSPKRDILAESQVYNSVASLFENEPDLIREFSLYLPGVCGILDKSTQNSDLAFKSKTSKDGSRATLVISPQPVCVPNEGTVIATNCASSTSLKRHLQRQPAIIRKKAKFGAVDVVSNDYNHDDLIKNVSLDEYLFFDKVQRLLNPDSFQNFLRCLLLYNQGITSKHELIELVTPYLSKRPELTKYLMDLISNNRSPENQLIVDENRRKIKASEETSSELSSHKKDYATGKRLGISYRALPESYSRVKCSGRTPLCQSVLNDTWVSFPSWSSEDTSCVHSKKSQFEEFMYRMEDERFELDIVIEVNKSAINTLEFLQRKMTRMGKEDLAKFKLDSSLGATSPTIMYRALKRVYGENANKMLEGAQRNPALVVPRLLQRLRGKEKEWREQQAGFNRIWREQTEKYYAKSLDHQAFTFKANDMKQLRSKMIIHQFETLYDERETRIEETSSIESGPHCIYKYPKDMNVLYDVNDLIIHYVRRQTNIQISEKRYIKRFLRRLIPELFNIDPQELSDDEDGEETDFNEKMDAETESGIRPTRRNCAIKEEKSGETKLLHNTDSHQKIQKIDATEILQASVEESISAPDKLQKKGTAYRLIYGANSWCIFLRLHQALCDRLARLKKINADLLENYQVEERIRYGQKEALRQCSVGRVEHNLQSDEDFGLNLLKKSRQCPENFYRTTILEIKNLLDGHIENMAFEDSIRCMFGTEAYITFTMDKIISTIGRQLQSMASDELQSNISTFELYNRYRLEHPPIMYVQSTNVKNIEAVYEKAAQQVFANQNCYKTYFLHSSNCVSVELIDSDVIEENGEKTKGEDHKWNSYVQNYIQTCHEDLTSLDTKEQQKLFERMSESPVFLMRLVRQGMERYRKREEDVKRKGKCRSRFQPNEKHRTFLNITEDLHVRFSQENNYQMRFVHGSFEFLLRGGAPKRGHSKHKTLVARRKERFTTWLEEKLCEDNVVAPRNWLSDGSKIIPVKHPAYAYLTYNRYVTTNDDIAPSASLP